MSGNEFDNSSDDEPIENSGSDSEFNADDYDNEIDSDDSVDCEKNSKPLGNEDKVSYFKYINLVTRGN